MVHLRNGHGFINRNDTNQSEFMYQTAVKNSLRKSHHSVGHGETVESGVAEGEKSAEIANVLGPGGVSGSGM